MKTNLIIIGLIFLNLSVSGQNKKVEHIIDDSSIKPWITGKTSEYQAHYHFSNSELESMLKLVIDQDSCYAQIQSSEWVWNNNKQILVQKYETIKNVIIKGNKFFSNKTNGEFVIFTVDNKQVKGLMVYKPWSSWIFYANSKGFELGSLYGPVYFQGKFSDASMRQLKKEELEKMSKSDLQIMLSEIYARYGYIFQPDGDMDLYFKKQTWYQGQKKTVDDCLTGLEKRNIALIKIVEKNR